MIVFALFACDSQLETAEEATFSGSEEPHSASYEVSDAWVDGDGCGFAKFVLGSLPSGTVEVDAASDGAFNIVYEDGDVDVCSLEGDTVLSCVSQQITDETPQSFGLGAAVVIDAAAHGALADGMLELTSVHPHFLFNSLNSLSALIEENPERAQEMVDRLASLFRYALSGSEKRTVPLSEEIAAIRDYLDVQSVRFEDRLGHRFELDSACSAIPVPPLVLQPLVDCRRAEQRNASGVES